MIHDSSLPAAVLTETEIAVPGPATCPLCHTPSSLSLDTLGAGGYWRCARCGQDWDAARLDGYAVYAAWVIEHDHAKLQAVSH
jgi:predicted Zn finger-like uncharacterized protein